MTMTITMGGSKNVRNSEKDAKIVRKKGYFLNFSIESTDYKHDHDHDQGGSKNVTNYEKGAKIEGKKGYILKFSMESIDYDHDHYHDHGGYSKCYKL